MFRSPRAAAVGRFAAGALLLCVLGLALLADLGAGSLHPPGAGVVLLLSAGVAGAVVLPVVGLRLRGGPQAWAACGAALVSLACSVRLGAAAAGPGSVLDQASDLYAFFEPTALITLLYVTARRGSRTGTVVGLPLLMTAVVLRPLAIDVDEGSSIVALVLTLVASGALAAGLTGRLVTASRRQREEQVRLEQRLAFARDLHDFVAHHISGIVVQAQGARAIADRKPQAVAGALALIEDTGAQALAAMREMVGALREDTGPRTGVPGAEAIRALAEGALLPGARVEYTESGPAAHLPADAAHLVERVVMEALTNVRKHARDCTAVQVALDVSRRRVTARITDDGRPGGPGQAARTGGGFGLRGLREVADAAGGTLTANPAPDGGAPGTGGGWQVALRLPLPLRQVHR
ncbi:sensor histidine kinase [Streptomyces abyssomicinicus]|uniref:sensor histidine kinase n=1 Tax=Streptomyces abyssomicinicus TaxID=574929 RepID=UPI001250AABA|nr:histidine kinase [Streptomyces abyssomicinicus]